MEAPTEMYDNKSENQQHPNVRERKLLVMKFMKSAKLTLPQNTIIQ
jgi:hypothetical protein